MFEFGETEFVDAVPPVEVHDPVPQVVADVEPDVVWYQAYV